MKCSSEMGKGYESSHMFHCSGVVAEGVEAVDVFVVLGESETSVVG